MRCAPRLYTLARCGIQMAHIRRAQRKDGITRGKAWPRGSDATTPNGGDGVEAEGLMVKG